MVEFEQWYDLVNSNINLTLTDKSILESAWLNGYDQGYVDGQEESDE